MATGGKDDNDKFSGDEKDKSHQNGDDDNIAKNLNNEADGSEENKKSTNRDENPFSFKKFLKAADSNHQVNGFRATPNRITNLDLAYDLPDFVQGRYNNSECDNRPTASTIDGNLPDFALHDANKSLGARPKIYNRVLPMFSTPTNNNAINNNNDDDDNILGAQNHEDSQPSTHPSNATDNCSNSLPDFLSDSGIGPTCIREPSNNHSDVFTSLKSHNAELLKRIDDLSHALDSERDRNHRLTQRLNRMKEADALAGAEKTVRQPSEGNKMDEKSNEPLLNQMKVLQDQIEALQTQQRSCTCSNNSRQHLAQAAQRVVGSAEQVQLHLRQLMASVDELRLASEVVASCSTSLPPPQPPTQQ
ncbi:hypothetical protein HELRODRAFT_192102 [Helobdella robusta]|uniref:Endosome-associated-trafficking regulator 1 n=1 Tax=Helobdella robusta TaxID=6412 RepID=T1FTK4_HELRO|nr:hypothetical protein HELRODRAFT_192102 [Helobdella robusta]ESO03065.1 hypothetical protein HELRODRAFT_192102 [Helobdella robusta]